MGGNVGSFTGALNLDISNVKGSLAQLQSILGRLDLTGGVQAKFTQSFKDIDKAIKAYESSLKKDFSKPLNISNIQGNFNTLQSLLGGLEKDINKISGKEIRLQISPADKAAMEAATKGLQNLNKLQEEYSNIAKKRAALAKSFADTGGDKGGMGASFVEKELAAGKKYDEVLAEIKSKQKEIVANSKTSIKSTLGTSVVTGMDLKTLESQKQSLQSLIALLSQAKKDKNGVIIPPEVAAKGLTSLDAIKVKITEATKLYNQLNSTAGNTYGGQAETFKKAGEFVKQYEAELRAAETATEALFKNAGIANITEMQGKIDGFVASLQKITTLNPEQLAKIKTELQSVIDEISNGSTQVEENINKQVDLSAKQQKIIDQYDMIASRIKYTFSLVNGLYILQRTIRSAFTSVKELDASMNEIAVVTEMTTSDLWDQIDAYNELATAMGATVKGGYDVAKLYYQQGKSQEEVNALTKETLKLSRISGIDYSQATDFMTAALNGFKLEVTDAARVSDIYSNLAAKAAVDTQEIAYAMTKTASIANNAGMSIENTAALLTQMMETTREAPENIGTAMKTIIARFAEMKSLVGTTFTDEEGDIVNVNRVEGALRAAGVKLRDAITGEIRPVDQVFLELASKWDGLTKNTQRYVATIAAGSRQQSRFIAMMDDYKRTTELVDIAQNSAGASDKQFAKTLDSLESKMNKLKNAWTEFTTGIADAKLIKVAVDMLTGLLNVVNNLTDGPGGGLGKLLLLFGGFKLAGNIVSRAVDGIKNTLVTQATHQMYTAGATLGQEVTKGVSAGMQRTFAQSIGASVTAKGLNAQLTKAFARNDGLLNYADISKVFSGGNNQNKRFLNPLKDNLKTMTPELADFTTALTGDFESGLKKLPDIAGEAGKKAVVEFNNAAATGDFGKAAQVYADFYEKTIPSLQKKALDENEKILAKHSSWMTDEVFTVNPAGLAGKDLEDYNQYQANKAFGTASITQPKVSVQTLTTLSAGFNNVANAAGSSGIAMAQVASILQGAGFTDASGILNSIGTAMMTVGSISSTVATIMAAEWTAASIAMAGVIAIAAIAAGVAFAIYQISPEKKLKDLEEATTFAQDRANEADEAYSSLLDNISDHQAAVEAMDSLVAGTIDFKIALLDANEQMSLLIKKYPALYAASGNGQYMTTDENGVQNLTSAGVEYVKTQAYQARILADSVVTDLTVATNKQASAIELNNLAKTISQNGSESGLTEDTANAIEQLSALAQNKGLTINSDDFWARSDVQKVLTDTLHTYALDSTTESLGYNKILADKLQLNADAIQTYAQQNAIDQQKNQLLYRQMGSQYIANDKILSQSLFGNVANDSLSQYFTGANTGKTLRYGETLVEGGTAKYSRRAMNEKYNTFGTGQYFNNLKKEYAALSNQYYDPGSQKVYTDSTKNKLVDLKNSDTVLEQLAALENVADYQDQVSGLIKKLDSANATGKFTKLMTKSKEMTSKDYADLAQEANALYQEQKIDKDTYAALLDSVNSGFEARKETTTTLTKQLIDAGIGEGGLQNFTDNLSNYSDEYLETISNTMADFTNNLGTESAKAFYDRATGLTSPEDISDYITALNSINGENTITQLDGINNAIMKNSGAVKTALEQDRDAIINAPDSLTTAFTDLYTSSSFDDARKALDDIYKTDKKLTGSNIREVAKDSELLSMYLEQGTMSAEALAQVLESVELGDLGIEQITDQLIAAVQAANTFKSALNDAYDDIDNPDFQRSMGDLDAHGKTLVDDVLGGLSSGLIGDPVLWDKFGEIFGENTRDTVVKGINEAAKNPDAAAAKAAIQALLDPYGKVMQQISTDGTLEGLWTQLNTGKAGAVTGPAFEGTLTADGLYIEKVKQGTEESIKQIQDMYKEAGLSYETARLLFFSSISHGAPGIGQQYQDMDSASAVTAWVDNFKQGGSQYILQSELDVMESMFAGSSAKIAQMLSDIPVVKLADDWATSAGKALDNLESAFADAGVNLKSLLISNGTINPAAGTADLDKLRQAFIEAGASATEADAAITDMATKGTYGIKELTKEVSVYNAETKQWTTETKHAPTIEGLNQVIDQVSQQNIGAVIAGALGEIKVTFNGDPSTLQAVIAGVRASEEATPINITVNYVLGSTAGLEAGPGGVKSGIKGKSSGAVVGTISGDGKKDHSSGPSLISERGDELVLTDSGAYLAQGPQFVNLKPNDVVYTAEETQRIFNNQKKAFPRFENGTPGWSYLGGFTFGGASGVSGGSGNAAESKKFENDLDKQYNLLQIIEDILRRQEKLQDELVNDAKISATEVAKNLAKQTELMQDELESSQELLKRRKDEVAEFLKENEKYKDFGSYDLETGLITIDWDKINKEGDKETLEYIEELEKLQENVQDAEDKIDDANATLEEIAQQGRDTYYELQDRLYDAISEREQGIIDGLSANNDAITNSNSALLNSLQKQVDSDRQARENSDTESDIAAKERRLALLQRDTSGSYALEIKQLQDEIKSAKEDYTDTLVDQAIQQLQDSYDLAAEARGREIEMLQNQKDWREENGYYWNEVLALMSGSAYGNATDQTAIDQIMALLGQVDSEYFGGSEEQKQQYIEDLTSQFSEALGWYWNQAENKLVESRTENIQNDNGTITTNVYQKTTYYDPDGTVSSAEEKLVSSETSHPITIDPRESEGFPTKPIGGGKGSVYSYVGKDGKTYTTPYASEALKNSKHSTGYTGGQVQKGLADMLKKGNIKKVPAYKKGGLADYTGPAWLDGSKSKPELVLNGTDTQNFMSIVDTMRDMKDGSLGQGNLTQIQVDLNIDKLDNNTDFDALADKVEKAIIKKAGYRNVTILSKGR